MVGTSVTASITAPVCMLSVTSSGGGGMPNMLDTPKNSPAMSKDDNRADTPQSQKTVKVLNLQSIYYRLGFAVTPCVISTIAKLRYRF